jgi:hypothetical protein
VGVHHACLGVAELFLADMRREPFDRGRGPVRREDPGAEAGGGQAQAARSGCDVHEPVTDPQACEGETRMRERSLAGGDELVVALRDRVPGLGRGDLVVVRRRPAIQNAHRVARATSRSRTHS